LDGVTYFGSAGLNAVLGCYERGNADGIAAHRGHKTRCRASAVPDGLRRSFRRRVAADTTMGHLGTAASSAATHRGLKSTDTGMPWACRGPNG
jgi:hypothetical protein